MIRSYLFERMRTVGGVLMIALAAVAGRPFPSLAACTDDTAVAVVRQRIETKCPCSKAPSRDEYLACAQRVVRRQIERGTLPLECRPTVMGCVRRSVCGRPNHVAACLVRDGEARCRVVPAEVLPEPGPGVPVCLRGQRSCCDAGCTADACAVPPPTCGDSETPGAGYPQCGGSCEPGLVCQALGISRFPPEVDNLRCVCTRPDVPCGGESLQCTDDDVFELGVCPPGATCWAFFGGAECLCLPLEIP